MAASQIVQWEETLNSCSRRAASAGTRGELSAWDAQKAELDGWWDGWTQEWVLRVGRSLTADNGRA